MNTNICTTCGESKTIEGARFEHVRIGLDEPPEPVLCRCKSQKDYVSSIERRILDAASITTMNSGMTMNQLVSANVNPAEIMSVEPDAKMEVEMRLSSTISECVFDYMRQGMFGSTIIEPVQEVGCSMWIPDPICMNSKVRIRSNGEQVIKVPAHVYSIGPGLKLAISYEYEFMGTIMRPDYSVDMDEVSIKYMVQGVEIKMIARKYMVEDTSSYSAEIEIMQTVTDMKLRMIMDWITSIVGSVRSIANEIDFEYMSSARSADHAVVDVSDMNIYKGTFMLKADGMKVYVFCYSFGYVVTMTDMSLTVLTYRFACVNQPLHEMTRMPDIMVAEMMMDGSLIYIDTLARDGSPSPTSRAYESRPTSRCQYPTMIVRRSWNSVPSMAKRRYTSMPNDGLVCVTPFRTLRLKEPTVDLRYLGGNLCSVEAGSSVVVASGCENMTEGVIYEMKVCRSEDMDKTMLTSPIPRVSKLMPNNMDIVRRAVASVSKDISMSTSLFDITSMSFSMRSRVYEMAQASATSTRKVIVIFGCGRLQEWKQMKLSNFSYIAIDPEIEIERLAKNMNKVTVMPYDMRSKFSTNVMSISKRQGSILYCKSRSEDFIARTGASQFMSANGIPAVFSFSISYHVGVINMLNNAGVICYGCGFAHDGMNKEVIGTKPVTMTRRTSSNSTVEVIATFGKSTYVEPFLSVKSVMGMKLVRDSLKDVWSNVDSGTLEIMQRAVIMSTSGTSR